MSSSTDDTTASGHAGTVASGVSGFDTLVGGSLPRDRLYVVSGPPGSGKTTFSVQFITQGVRQNERCLYVSMHETEADLVTDMSGYDMPFEQVAASDRFQFMDLMSSQGQRLLGLKNNSAGSRSEITNAANRFTNYVDTNDIDRVVIDSTMVLEHYFGDESDILVAFLTALKNVDATVYLISEMTDPSSYADEHYLSHGVVFLHNFLDRDGSASKMVRGVQVIKMRGREVDGQIKRVEFSDDGLEVFPNTPVSP